MLERKNFVKCLAAIHHIQDYIVETAHLDELCHA